MPEMVIGLVCEGKTDYIILKAYYLDLCCPMEYRQLSADSSHRETPRAAPTGTAGGVKCISGASEMGRKLESGSMRQKISLELSRPDLVTSSSFTLMATFVMRCSTKVRG